MEANGLTEAEALRERGALEEAKRRCEALLEANPGDAAALNLLGAIAADEGDAAAARQWVQRALAANPQSPAPHYTLGRVHQAEGRLGEAEASYRASLALDSGQAKAYNNLGCVLQMQGRLDDAAAAFRRALERDPSLAQAQQNLGSLTGERGLLEAAAAGLRKQVAADPGNALARHDLGNVCRDLGRMSEAIAWYEEALKCDPGYAAAHFALAQALLLCGRWPEGWMEHEWRWQVAGLGLPPRDFAQPQWDGAALRGATLLLHAEQGLGDTLQFMRYVPLAAARCREVIVECAPQLVELLRSVRGPARVVARGEPLPPFDAHLPLMSLPRIFATTTASVPWDGPYLHADPQRVARWKRELAPGARRHVGLAWAGRPQYWDDRKRSIALAAFEPLSRVEGVALYSLQWGEGAAQLVTRPPGLRIADFGDRIREFTDLAALMGCLDIVVSVDTVTTHLAGALGVPAWVLLPEAPDWRWLLERDDSPWYPSVRLFRQQSDRQWDGVIRRVSAELAALARKEKPGIVQP